MNLEEIPAFHLHVVHIPLAELLVAIQHALVCLVTSENLQTVDLNVPYILNVPQVSHVIMKNVRIRVLDLVVIIHCAL